MTMTMLFFRHVALMKHPYIFTIEQRTNLFSVLLVIYKTPHRYIPKYRQQPRTPPTSHKTIPTPPKRSKHPLGFFYMFCGALVVWGGGVWGMLHAFMGCWERLGVMVNWGRRLELGVVKM